MSADGGHRPPLQPGRGVKPPLHQTGSRAAELHPTTAEQGVLIVTGNPTEDSVEVCGGGARGV